MKMKYFKLSTQQGNSIPRIVNWYGKIDVRKLTRADYKQLPSYFMLDMKLGLDYIFPDILIDPFLLVSREAMEVIRMYDTQLPFIFIALFDTQKEESVSYYCPVLEEEEHLTDKEVLCKCKIGTEETVCIRLDLAESLLERGAIGMQLDCI